ncbi:MAG: hypothetical protein U0U70_01570 [Chitinophagaceae bacterium]
MTSQLSLSIIEIIVLMLGAIVLGITIHFFITSRKTLKASSPAAMMQTAKELEEWKLRYFNEIEYRDKELENLKRKLAEEEENNQINTIEAEETKKRNKKLLAEIEALKEQKPAAAPPVAGDYMNQLSLAQNSLKEYQEKISGILGQIDIVKEAEEKQQEIIRSNEELSGQIDELRYKLSQKEKEIHTIRQKHELTTEMASRLENAYTEFGLLQDKIQKLESQVQGSKKLNLEYEDLKEEHYKMVQEFEEQKKKYQAAYTENQELQAALNETGDKLREANFQRLQLQKKVAYLEELNNDMQAVADANKKLEGQLKRIGELESMLNMVSEERDELAKKQIKA